jgi:D-lyxose ketol-isomerase
MKRSEINRLIEQATDSFEAHGWALPPNPRWDVTDFGLGDWRRFGLVLVNLAEEPEYCEKLMYARRGMVTPRHHHLKKKEDIICRWGSLAIRVWPPGTAEFIRRESDLARSAALIRVNGIDRSVSEEETITLQAGERVTLPPGTDHEFEPASDECIIGEVSTANDDLHDNFFANPDVGRFPGIEEDEPLWSARL